MRIALAIALCLLLLACTQEAPSCSKPYISNGNTCCLDRDENAMCDTIVNEQLDCSLCPPQFVVQKEPVMVYRYVCANQSVMDNAGDCGAKIVSNANLFQVSKDQEEEFIEKFSSDAACRGKFPVAELHLVYAQKPENITLQILDDPERSFVNAAILPVAQEIYYYIGFCKDCQHLTDLQLDPTRAYAVRAVLQYPERKVYTREYVLDPTPEGPIGKKSCS